jgi:hypothetical protein
MFICSLELTYLVACRHAAKVWLAGYDGRIAEQAVGPGIDVPSPTLVHERPLYHVRL